MERYLNKQIRQDLSRKMVFIGGPRQVGKTTLAKNLQKNFAYYNWDIPQDRRLIRAQEFSNEPLLIFDEIQKYKSWRNYLKGLYDQLGKNKKILVTGSAKLDIMRRGGDSLQGRYHYLRLHPLSFAELKMKNTSDLETLFELGGFPEPFLSGSKKEANRWSREYSVRFFRDEVTSIQHIQDLGNMELLFDRLPDLVANPLSLNALREDLQIAHHTVNRWLKIFELFYGIFRLPPFGAPSIRAVKKEQKHYHYDWNLISQDGPRFENMIACHLLKWVNFLEDTEGRNLELRYFRDVDLKEVDFVVLENKKPILFVECKLSDDEVTRGLKYLNAKFPNVQAYQISLRGKKSFITATNIRVCSATEFLGDLV